VSCELCASQLSAGSPKAITAGADGTGKFQELFGQADYSVVGVGICRVCRDYSLLGTMNEIG
jgi:hypothetical protein